MTLRTAVVFALGLVGGAAITRGQVPDRRLPGMNGVNHLAFATTRA